MATKENINAAKQLVIRYRSITLDEIKDKQKELELSEFEVDKIMKSLTGFGYNYSCTLCKSIDKTMLNYVCNNCIYGSTNNCYMNENAQTYNKIENAETPKQLLNAINKRANHIEKILNNLDK